MLYPAEFLYPSDDLYPGQDFPEWLLEGLPVFTGSRNFRHDPVSKVTAMAKLDILKSNIKKLNSDAQIGTIKTDEKNEVSSLPETNDIG
jgi:hypothetical protein